MRRAPLFAILCFALAGCSSPAADQDDMGLDGLGLQATETTGIIRGFVLDEALRPLADALVQLASGAGNATTNDDGAFGFDGLEAGTHFLTVSRPDFVTIQQSADVVAGLAEPKPVKVVLAALPRATPFLESYAHSMFTAFQTPIISLGGAFDEAIGQGDSGFFQAPLQGNASVVQVELAWKPTLSTSQRVQLVGAARAETPDSSENVDYEIVQGESPLRSRSNATAEGLVATYFFMRVDAIPIDIETPSPPDPNSLAIVNQQYQGFAFAFYNMVPRDDWSFVRDGPYPV